MTKTSTKAEVNSFVQGLITEASPLNFPGNATVDEQNFVLNRNGTRNRRLGMDLEPGYTLFDIDATLDDIQNTKPITFRWMNVGGNGSRNYLVVQVRNKLYIFDLANQSLSTGGLIDTIDLTSLSFPTTVQYSFAAVDGKLVVAAGQNQIAVVSYNGTGFTVTGRTLLVRDVWGVEVTDESAYETDDQYRGTVSRNDHFYNLYNQSWGIPRSNSSGTLVDAVNNYFSGLSKYPSNSEVVWSGLDFQAVVGGTPFERQYPNLYTDTFGSKVKAAKGYFIIDVLNRGQSRSAVVSTNKAKHPAVALASFTTNTDATQGGAKIICEFAGRVFFAGFGGIVVDGDKRSPNLSNHILFSQLVKNTEDIVKCYQEGDPTSRDGSDIIDTDGGYIRIAGADNIVSMVNLGTHLIVFASNGVWSVTGGSDYGFTATNYKVNKITSFGALSRSSIVDDGGTALYWATDGIYILERNQIGDFAARNLTQTTIQTLYEEIPTASREQAVGVFDSAGKTIRWLYSTGTPFTADHITYELILDVVISAFYKFRIYNSPDNEAIASAPFAATPFTADFVPNVVVVGTDEVVVGLDTVVVEVASQGSSILSTRYLCIVLVAGVPKITFGYYNNTRWIDWESVDNVGTDAFGYFTTGAVTAGDSSAVKQTPYLILHFNRTENGVDDEMIPENQSGCLVRTQWDFANSVNSNKWSSQFQGYRLKQVYLVNNSEDAYDMGFEIITTRNKLRGRGRAFAFHMETQPGKDCQPVGWNISINGNSVT